MANKSRVDAYKLSSPHEITQGTALTNSNKLANRTLVKHAIRLGREVGAIAALAGIKRDIAWADDMLQKKIAKAEKLEQMTAVSSLVQQQLKLHGLLIDRQQIEQASLVVNISGVDTSRLVNPVRTLEHEGQNE